MSSSSVYGGGGTHLTTSSLVAIATAAMPKLGVAYAWTKAGQLIPPEEDVDFQALKGYGGIVGYNPANPSQLTVLRGGVYLIEFQLATACEVQFAIFVNGQLEPQSIHSGLLSTTPGKTVVQVEAGDTISLRNYISGSPVPMPVTLGFSTGTAPEGAVTASLMLVLVIPASS
jgi:hypothetical protein